MAPPRIVVVDDDPTMVQLMEQILSDEGYAVIPWRSGAGAYRLIRDQQPAVVILDIRMEHPEAGWELVEILRLSAHTADIPILICSADVQFLRSHEQDFVAKDCAVLSKPFHVEALLELVARLVQS
jgi:CheY-like chemotaxis protein